MAKELLPNVIPTKPVGNGPLTPVGIFTVGLSGVNIVEVVELRSSPALPGVALISSVMGRRVCMGSMLLPQSLSGPEAGPSTCFPTAGQELARFRFYGILICSPLSSDIPSDNEGKES